MSYQSNVIQIYSMILNWFYRLLICPLKSYRELKTSLNKLMKLGVNDYESQSDRLNEALGKAILEGKTQAVKQLQDQLKILSTYGEAYMSLRDNLEFRRKSLGDPANRALIPNPRRLLPANPHFS